MGISIRRDKFVRLEDLIYQLHLDMVEAGFELVGTSVFGERTPTSQLINPTVQLNVPEAGKTARYMFKATNRVDRLASAEPWMIIFEVHPHFLRCWALTENALDYDRNGNLTVKEIPEVFQVENLPPDTTCEFGYMSKLGHYKEETYGSQFLSLIPTESTWFNYEDVPVDANGYRIMAAAPLSYRLTISNNGIAFYCFSPKHSDTGNCHSWFVVQRLVNHLGKVDFTKGFNPVWCLFSQNGGGESTHSIFGEVDNAPLDASGIQQFCLRERDIKFPTPCVSALVPSQIGSAVIGNSQSVRHTEKGGWEVEIPTGFSTWRHKYTLFADLIGMASADMTTHTGVVLDDAFLEGEDRSYVGMQANFKNNKGQRLFMLLDGPGIAKSTELIPFASNLGQYHPATDDFVKFFELKLKDLLGTEVSSDRGIIVPFNVVIDQTTAEFGIDYLIPENSLLVLKTKNNIPVSIEILGPQVVQEETTMEYRLLVTFSDGSTSIQSLQQGIYSSMISYTNIGDLNTDPNVPQADKISLMTFDPLGLPNTKVMTLNASVNSTGTEFLTTSIDILIQKTVAPDYLFPEHLPLVEEISGELMFHDGVFNVGVYGQILPTESTSPKVIKFHLDVSGIWEGNPDFFFTYTIG